MAWRVGRIVLCIVVALLIVATPAECAGVKRGPKGGTAVSQPIRSSHFPQSLLHAQWGGDGQEKAAAQCMEESRNFHSRHCNRRRIDFSCAPLMWTWCCVSPWAHTLPRPPQSSNLWCNLTSVAGRRRIGSSAHEGPNARKMHVRVSRSAPQFCTWEGMCWNVKDWGCHSNKGLRCGEARRLTIDPLLLCRAARSREAGMYLQVYIGGLLGRGVFKGPCEYPRQHMHPLNRSLPFSLSPFLPTQSTHPRPS